MSIIPWRNKRHEADQAQAAPLIQFRSEMDRLFDQFFNEAWGLPVPRGAGSDFASFAPSLDVAETPDEVRVRVEVPGMAAADIDLKVIGDVLTITGEKKQQSECEVESAYHAECSYGSFRRAVRLPAAIDADKVKAEYGQGVLTVHLPRSERAKPRRIDVRSA